MLIVPVVCEVVGHTDDAHMSPAKCQAIVKDEAPTDVTKLCYFLGLQYLCLVGS